MLVSILVLLLAGCPTGDGEAAADLELSKHASAEAAGPGGTVSFDIALHNRGPGEATGVVVEEELPEGLAVTSATATAGTFEAEMWVLPRLAAGQTETLTLLAEVTAAAPDVLENAAHVLAVDQADPDSTPGDQAEEDDRDTARIEVTEETFTVAGEVVVSDSAVADGDVNNTDTPYQPNDTLEQAQPVPNPATVAGYGNVAGAGPEGPSREPGDPVDLYVASLAESQLVQLFVAEDGVTHDLDLCLADPDSGELLTCAETTERVEQVVVPSDGEYAVAVLPFQGASSYALTVGLPAPDTRARTVPGELVVRLSGAARRSAVPLADRAAAFGMAHVAGRAETEVLWRVEDPRRAATALGHRLWTDEAQLARALQAHPDIEAASPNYVRRTMFEPSDEYYPYQWHYPQIGLPQAWDLADGSGRIVAVVDTGVVLSHPDLSGQLLAGYDFIRDPSSSGDGDGIDDDPDDPGDSPTPGLSSWHGTHVAGTVAARTGDGSGVAGVARDGRVMPLRALGIGGGTDYDIMQAIRFAAGMANDSGTVPPARAHVVNLSIGGPGYSSVFEALIGDVRDRGVVVVAAAGNQGSTEPMYPASLDGVISVSAVDMADELTAYSNRGPDIDVAAPGGDASQDLDGDGFADGVLSTAADDTDGPIEPLYAFYQGTSMAAPHVAGVVALMRSANPDLTPADVDALLASGAMTTDLGPPGRDDTTGHGRIDARAAVAAAISAAGGTPANDPLLAVTPTSLSFPPGVSELSLQVRNAGGGTLAVEAPTDDAPWLTVGAPTVSEEVSTYPVTVSRSDLELGTHAATITFTSSANTVSVSVLLQVGPPPGGDLGTHYILLTTSDFVPVREIAVSVQGGRYPFAFTDVPPGEYYLFAGTDYDNDLFICDEGEACGAWPSLSKSEVVVVDRDRDDLVFLSTIAIDLADP